MRALFTLSIVSWSVASRDVKMSDPDTYTETIMDSPGQDSFIIPAYLVIPEDPQTNSEAPGPALNPNDFSQAEKLNDPEVMFDESNADDPIMRANLFQGDIRISSNDELFLLNSHGSVDPSTGYSRNAIIEQKKKWTNGVIPYQIGASYNADERAKIAKAIAEIHFHTCIKFIPKTGEKDFIFIKKQAGCSSAVGRVGKVQTVSLGEGCVYFGIIIHELMHAIGFWHEQSRADRDDHVWIYWNNIKDGMEYNFHKYTWSVIQNLGVGYDTDSIMHYSENSFAKNRRMPTIKAKNGNSIGQRNHMSQLDVLKINKLYECNSVKPLPPTVITKPESCVDHNIFCPKWAQRNECKKNPLWMNPNCKKSCKQCNVCQDYNEFCKEWSKAGECYASHDYMMYHCRKSCNFCGKGPSDCTDKNKYCKEWSLAGECRKNPKYMLKYCKKSCKKC